MKILVTGGGTGGHVIPILAVTVELKRIDPSIELLFVAQKGDPSQDIIRKRAPKLPVYEISAGKFRRFHNLTFKQRLQNLPLMFRNMADGCKVALGVAQSYYLILKERPNAVFVKGGFVGLPVGIAARMRRVPIITHDSDAVPGLTNRILSRWAEVNAVAMPVACYHGIYQDRKVMQTGLPIDASFAKLASTPKQQLRKDLGLPQRQPMILVMPGSSGAVSINRAVVAIAKDMIADGYSVVHVTGPKHFQDMVQAYENKGVDKRYLTVRPFVDNPAEFTRAADVVVTRSGSMMLELAAQSCAVVCVPHPHLTGGHQLKNAALYDTAKAAVVLSDADVVAKPELLQQALTQLISSADRRKRLGEALHAFYQPKAAKALAALLRERATK